MLRGNLSTRPFYNERAVQAALAVVAAVLGALALVAAWQLWALTAQQGELSARIARDEARAAGLRREAAQVRGRIDQQMLESTVRATREANRAIDARTFSWTALFNVLERTMPPDVRLQSVTPSFDGEALIVRLIINARRVEPVGLFMDRLEDAGAFEELRSVEEQALEDGTLNIVCEGRYLGPGAPPAATPASETETADAGRGAAPAGGVVPRAGAR